jgi:glycine/D-amino acid oxidase-like deaminating enzyme
LEGSYAASVASTSNKVEVALVAELTAGGTLLLGSSREFAGYDTTVSAAVVQAIAARAVRLLPSLAQASVIRSYAGLRPWSPDHLPLVGPVAQAPGLYLATGHEGAGIGLAPVTGELIAGCITGTELPAYAHAVRPDRFALSN